MDVKLKIIELCYNLFGDTKEGVKANNKSVDILISIFEELREQGERAEEIYNSLLDFPDDRVRFEAATCCMKLNKNIIKAKKVLKHISQTNQNPAIRFSADMILETWDESGCLK